MPEAPGDYLDAIGEQIENPHARCAIRREIGNHIEEQTEDYHREGMTPLAAAQEAVRQMGIRCRPAGN